MFFKGPGSFKKKFKIGGNVDELKGYRLIPLTPPLFLHFTLPLKGQYHKQSNEASCPGLGRTNHKFKFLATAI